MSRPSMSTPPRESRLPHVISEPTPPPGWQPPEMPPPWLREALHIKSPPENVHRPPTEICPAWGCGSPPIVPLPGKTVNEILKEVEKVEKHGEIPIAVSPTRVIETPRPQHAAPSHLALHEEGESSNTVKPLQEVPTHVSPKTALHAEALPAHVHAEVPTREQNQPQHLWVGWRVGPEMEKYVKEFIETFEHGRHVGHPPIMFPMLGGVLAPTPGAPTAPAPGAPVAIAPPQGAGNQQGVAVSLP